MLPLAIDGLHASAHPIVLCSPSYRVIGHYQATILFGDAVAEEIHINPTVAAFDMQMLIGTKGRERTPSEWQRLLKNAGFEIVELMNVRTFAKFIIAK